MGRCVSSFSPPPPPIPQSPAVSFSIFLFVFLLQMEPLKIVRSLFYSSKRPFPIGFRFAAAAAAPLFHSFLSPPTSTFVSVRFGCSFFCHLLFVLVFRWFPATRKRGRQYSEKI